MLTLQWQNKAKAQLNQTKPIRTHPNSVTTLGLPTDVHFPLGAAARIFPTGFYPFFLARCYHCYRFAFPIFFLFFRIFSIFFCCGCSPLLWSQLQQQVKIRQRQYWNDNRMRMRMRIRMWMKASEKMGNGLWLGIGMGIWLEYLGRTGGNVAVAFPAETQKLM